MVRFGSQQWYKRDSMARRIQRRYRARSNARKYSGKISLNRRIKSISLRQCETKKSHQRFGAGTSAQELFHNVTHYWDNLLATTQGFDDPQGNTQDTRNRIGTDIIARGLKLKIMFFSNTDRPNLNVHAYLYKYNSNSFPMTDSGFWAGPLGMGADSNRLLDHPNTDRVQSLRKIVVQNRNNYSITNSGNERVMTVYREIYLPFKNWKIRYDNDTEGGKIPMYKDIGLAIVAYDTPDTNELQSVARVTASTCLYFKDP